MYDRSTRRHAHLVLIHIGVQQLFVAAVDDCGPVTGSKDMLDAIALKGLEGDGLAAQTQLLPVTQLPCEPQLSQAQWHEVVYKLTVPKYAQQSILCNFALLKLS